MKSSTYSWVLMGFSNWSHRSKRAKLTETSFKLPFSLQNTTTDWDTITRHVFHLIIFTLTFFQSRLDSLESFISFLRHRKAGWFLCVCEKHPCVFRVQQENITRGCFSTTWKQRNHSQRCYLNTYLMCHAVNSCLIRQFPHTRAPSHTQVKRVVPLPTPGEPDTHTPLSKLGGSLSQKGRKAN